MRITKEYLDTLAAKSGLSRDTIRCRLKSGWSEERILATPLDEARSKAAKQTPQPNAKKKAPVKPSPGLRWKTTSADTPYPVG